ncbi:MAG: enoyl-ACP reductase [SAR202 cluster bacterium Io17-Chloro-G9]|nr:MAG: enoyl-ACP reductase [SAR202 cluster bacterium Io17-Chloro-G9]
MYPIDLSGKCGVILGVANDRSIAWAIANVLAQAGARLALTYQNDRLKDRVARLADTLDDALLVECDATNDEQISNLFHQVEGTFGEISFLVHSIAFANREDLARPFAETGREGFRLALEVSAYSLIPLVRQAAPLMKNGGSVVTMTFHASQRVYPGYNVMGTAKAALEHEVRQLAAEFGEQNIRLNAISAGPLETLAARGIHGFMDMKRVHAERAPMGRNITAEEVAKTALFLCSDLATGITGSIIPVDAGYHIMAV